MEQCRGEKQVEGLGEALKLRILLVFKTSKLDCCCLSCAGGGMAAAQPRIIHSAYTKLNRLQRVFLVHK